MFWQVNVQAYTNYMLAFVLGESGDSWVGGELKGQIIYFWMFSFICLKWIWKKHFQVYLNCVPKSGERSTDHVYNFSQKNIAYFAKYWGLKDLGLRHHLGRVFFILPHYTSSFTADNLRLMTSACYRPGYCYVVRANQSCL